MVRVSIVSIKVFSSSKKFKSTGVYGPPLGGGDGGGRAERAGYQAAAPALDVSALSVGGFDGEAAAAGRRGFDFACAALSGKVPVSVFVPAAAGVVPGPDSATATSRVTVSRTGLEACS